MLVLSRRVGETMVVSGQIEVTVLEIQAGQVRLGWKAPSHVEILRKEICRGRTHRASRPAPPPRGSKSLPG